MAIRILQNAPPRKSSVSSFVMRQPSFRRAFTLIEMVVVIAIIAILMVAIVAIGTAVRANANRRSTLAELKLLSGVMQDYLAAGNPEPQAPVDTTSANMWPYGTSTDGGYRLFSYVAFYRTAPPSDPYNWVIALKSIPEFAKKISGLPHGDDSAVPRMDATPVIHSLILDSFGTHIRYVPSDPTTNRAGYFMSAGPDGKFSVMVEDNKSSTISDGAEHETTTMVLPPDEIYSTDPQ